MPGYYTVAKIGRTREITPEGFLLLRDVAVARTGEMVYHPEEINRPGRPPIRPNRPDGLVAVTRDAEDVFRKETLDSLNGKPFLNEHPKRDEDWVSAQNWREFTNGIVLSPRRGTGSDSDLTIADVVVFCPGQMQLIDDGKEEVSCGYDCEYFQIEDGKVYQRNIIYNHLALVGAGRCGERCSIGDSKPGEELMAPTAKKSWLDKLKAAVSGNDPAAAKKVFDEMPAEMMESDDAPSGVAVHVHAPSTGAVGDRKWSDEKLDEKFTALEKGANDNHKSVMDSLEEMKKKLEPKTEDDGEEKKKIEGELEEEAPAGSGEDAKKAKDSAFLADSFTNTLSMAEIIAPGIHLPTFDKALAPTETFKSICSLRKKALTFGNGDAKTNALILTANGGRELTNDAIAKMPCGSVRTLFNAVGGLKKAENSATTRTGTADSKQNMSQVPSLAEMNKNAREIWNAKKKG